MSVHERLGSTIAAVNGKPIVWGVDDCSAWAAGWLRGNGHAVTLPAYASEHEARRCIARAGGLLPLWTEALTAAGLWGTTDPRAGDVGLIETANHGPVGGIFCDGAGFLWRTRTGVTLLYPRPQTIIAAWSIACGA